MTERNHKIKFQDVLKKYLSEVIVIFIGISISFWFDEWRDDRKDKELERKYLENLRSNLVQDTLILQYSIESGRVLTRSTQLLAIFKSDTEIADSISFHIDNSSSYYSFMPNQTTYEELKQNGHTRLIQTDSLKKFILNHYTLMLPYCKEWIEVDKMHTMTQLIPEMSNYFPVVPDTTNMVSVQNKIKALRMPKIKHLLLTNAAYKQENLKAFGITKNSARYVIKLIDKELGKK